MNAVQQQPKLYSTSRAKRHDVTGTSKELFQEPLVKSVLQRIETNLICAIGFINGVNQLQYLFNPQIRHNLDGNPTSIVGNASDAQGNLTIITLDVEEMLTYFLVVSKSARADEYFKGATDLPTNLIAGTRWANTTDADGNAQVYAACAVPKVFVLFHGTKPVYGNILNGDTKLALADLGDGYESFANMIELYEASKNDCAVVYTRIEGEANGVTTYLHGDFAGNEPKRTLKSGGPAVCVNMVPESMFPAEAESIKQFFQPSGFSALGGSSGSAGPGLVIRSAEEGEKETLSQMGISSLLLFFSGGEIRNNKLKKGTIIWGIASQLLLDIKNGPQSVRTRRWHQALKSAFNLDGGNVDAFDLLNKLTLKIIQLPMANMLINGQFSTQPISGFKPESNTIGADAFLPQTDMALVRRIENQEQRFFNEGLMGLAASQQSAPLSALQRVGTVTNMQSVFSFCINVMNLAELVCDLEKMREKKALPVMLQLCSKFMHMYSNFPVAEWLAALESQMPHHAKNAFAIWDTCWALCGRAATDHANVTAKMSTHGTPDNCTFASFDNAIETMENFLLTIRMLALNTAPDTNYSRFASRPEPVAALPAPAPAPSNEDGGGKKRKQGGGKGKNRGGKDDDAKKSKGGADTPGSQKGWIHLANPNMPKDNILPNNLEKKYCVDFMCQGLDCPAPSAGCDNGIHAYNPKKMTPGDLEKTLAHAKANGHAWFSANSFKKYEEFKIPQEFEGLFGSKHGRHGT